MIKIRDFDAICRGWVNDIEALDGYVLVVEDGHATRKLRDRRGIWLVAVVPNSQSTGTPGMISETNSVMLWVVNKGWADKTDDEELNQYEKTQDIILDIREAVIANQEEGCGPFWQLQPSTITIDPDFNAFGGWNGWVMQFVF